MFKDKNQKQKGGDKSTNLQAQKINIYQGISYQDAKQIALDVFKSNFLELSQAAADLAIQRAEEFTDKFLEVLQDRNPKAIENVDKPSLQYALYSAQKDFAKTGDEDLLNTLVDILVDVSGEKERTLKYIVLEESLSTAPKLTAGQLDILSLVFIVTEAKFNRMGSFQLMDEFLTKHIMPFAENIQSVNSLYNHLIYTGCCNSRHFVIGNEKMEDYFIDKYRGLFQVGFSKEEFLQKFEEDEGVFNQVTCPCLQNNEIFQIDSVSVYDLDKECEALGITLDIKNRLVQFFISNTMKKEDVKIFLIKRHPWISDVLEKWEESMLQLITLTSVGIAIGQANFRRKTGVPIDLEIWIKETD